MYTPPAFAENHPQPLAAPIAAYPLGLVITGGPAGLIGPRPPIATRLHSIVRSKISISHLAGKWKVSQNRKDANRNGVRAGLADHPMAAAIA